MYRVGLIALGIVPLVACDFDSFNGLVAPVVGQGMVLGIEIPELPGIDMSQMPFDQGTAVTMFLANAQQASDMESAPIRNATVTVKSLPDVDPVTAGNAGDGMYQILPDGSENPPVDYVEEADWTLLSKIPRQEDVGKINVHLPPAGNPTVPEQVDPATEVIIPFTQGNFTSAVVVVSDATSGEVTYSTKPETIKDVYDLTRSNEPVTSVTLPPTAFPEENKVYLLGITGVNHTTGDDIDGMNTLLSTGMAGKMQLFPVRTFTLPDTDALQ